MKQFLILLWILWVQMAFIFSITSIYFIRLGNWRGLITVPLFLFTAYCGWRLYMKSRHEWRQSA